MGKAKRISIKVQGTTIGILPQADGDFISLTDMVKNFDGTTALIDQWLRNKDSILFLGIWERINNPDFNSLEFEGIRNNAGRNSFFLSIRKWIGMARAKGLIASAGRYGGTYAHKDIAFEFGSWPEGLFMITPPNVKVTPIFREAQQCLVNFVATDKVVQFISPGVAWLNQIEKVLKYYAGVVQPD
jgi:hypothetical protein